MDTWTNRAWERQFPTLTAPDIREFAAAIGDFNPIHHDDAAAQAKGFDSLIAPGVRTIAFISAAIAEEVPGAIIKGVDLDFKRPLYPGTAPLVKCLVVGTREAGQKVIASVQVFVSGAKLLLSGSCEIVLPTA